ncbi:MAG: RNA 2',3'-cyclic phosphodiesterase [Pseudomonadota bacterium]
MPRLFTGIAIPADIALSLSFLRGGIRGARWIDQESYHLTLRFVGDIENDTAAELVDALGSVTGPRFEMELRGSGHFGNLKPRAVWAAVSAPPELTELQTRQERLCQRLGLAPEPRKFTPHVTLARLKGRVSPLEVEDFEARHSGFRSPPFEVREFVLYSSRPSKGGGPYVVEETYPLL